MIATKSNCSFQIKKTWCSPVLFHNYLYKLTWQVKFFKSLVWYYPVNKDGMNLTHTEVRNSVPQFFHLSNFVTDTIQKKSAAPIVFLYRPFNSKGSTKEESLNIVM